jgi:hypothetical protein
MAPFFGCPPPWVISEKDSYNVGESGKGRSGSAWPAGASYGEFCDGQSPVCDGRLWGMDSPAPLSAAEKRAWAELVSRY